MKEKEADLEIVLKKATELLHKKESIKKELSHNGRATCTVETEKYELGTEINELQESKDEVVDTNVSNIEKDIKIIKEEFKDEYFGDMLWGELKPAVEHLLADYEKLQEEFKAVDSECSRLERKEVEQEKIIDLMAEQLAGLAIFNDDKNEALILGDKEEVKQLEKENEELKEKNLIQEAMIKDSISKETIKNFFIEKKKIKEKIEEILNNKEYRIVFEGNAEIPDNATNINAQKYIKLEKMQELLESEEK